jgi:hypothetical protein
LPFNLGGGYTPPDRHALAFGLPPSDADEDRITGVGQFGQSGQSVTGSAKLIIRGVGQFGQVQSFDGALTDFAAVGTGLFLQAQNIAGRGHVIVRRVAFAQSAERWNVGEQTDREFANPLSIGALVDRVVCARTPSAAANDRSSEIAWAVSSSADAERSISLAPGSPLDTTTRSRWRASSPFDHERTSRWQLAQRLDAVPRSARWRNPPAHDSGRKIRWGSGVPHWLDLLAATDKAVVRDVQRKIPWGPGGPPAPIWVLPLPPKPPRPAQPPCYVPPDRHDIRIRFAGQVAYIPPSRHVLEALLRCGPERYYYLRQSLLMSHSLSVTRLDDDLPLSVAGVSISTDADSWAWTFELRLRTRSSYVAIAPTVDALQSVRIDLDGHIWTALIESDREQRAHNNRSWSVSGRSRTALMADPYRPARSYTSTALATAEQLARAELDYTDFDLDWSLPMWSVPAGAWAYDRETPVSAIVRIAQSAGGIVQAHQSEDVLLVQPRYPTKPWAWDDAEPDMTIDAGACLTLSRRALAGQGYNGVWVSGKTAGVRVNVVRDGTSGSPYAQSLVDPLITEIAPATNRGVQVIADAEWRQEIQLLMPLMPNPVAPGLLLPGMLVEVEDATWGVYRAQVTAVSVSADVDDNGLLTARQTVTVRRHQRPSS